MMQVKEALKQHARRKGLWNAIRHKIHARRTARDDYICLIDEKEKTKWTNVVCSSKDNKNKQKKQQKNKYVVKCTDKNIAEKDTKVKDRQDGSKKRKTILKSIGHNVVSVCRYMGIGAAMANPSTFASAYTVPFGDPFQYPQYDYVSSERHRQYNGYY